ncbi:hypothetical protein [Halobacteriovorax sp. JY17]|uniref:hypothetical protein n=1 Tax=Halobacteriovorax sp. JY17 TaxID=2014617 RepID=UPI000C4CE7DF|nr:hypothetical protein [Halobacteriovorax sp. JY17]PIK15089.1 MAG: hypothetical protein CES88_12195 [Halobacteriovorax sp. JY17]
MNKHILITSLLLSLYGAAIGYFLGNPVNQAIASFVGFFVAGLVFSKMTKRVFEFPLEVIVMIVLFPAGLFLGYSSLMIFNILLIITIQVVVKHFARK